MDGIADDVAISLSATGAETPFSMRRHGIAAGATNPAAIAGKSFAMDALVTFALSLVTYDVLVAPVWQWDHWVFILLTLFSAIVVGGLWERGVYEVPMLLERRLHVHKIALSWIQAAGLVLLLALCLLGAAPSALPSGQAAELHLAVTGAWLPTLVAFGVVSLSALRFIRLRFGTPIPAPYRAVIVGCTDVATRLLEKIACSPARCLNFIGVVAHTTEREEERKSFCSLPVLGGVPALVEMIRHDQVDVVIVALPWSDAPRLRGIVDQIAMAPVDVLVAPDLDGFDFTSRPVSSFHAGVPLLQASRRPLTGRQAFLKRAEDLFLGGILLLLTAPAMLGIALAVKLTSSGPVLFRQRRLGFNNRIINVMKFRTMYAHLSDPDARQQTSRGDRRITPIGGWLRRSSLDELPQLLNVLRGDMSLVGPRPHALMTRASGLALEDAVPTYSSRHRVKPGITGWAQVNGFRGELDTVDKIVHRVNHDLHYVDNWSLALDLKILWRTAKLVVTDNNAY
jgi:Undecaprenyl-phosphate glucose phosphotransferase